MQNRHPVGKIVYQVPVLLRREVTLAPGGTIGLNTYRPNNTGTFSLCLGRRLEALESRLLSEAQQGPSPSSLVVQVITHPSVRNHG